jgi:glycerol-3-phosphate dehydrogenase
MGDGYGRDRDWSLLNEAWDLVVIGGGITGAGIFAEAARGGLRTLLVEQRDFAWGTSSRSSKLVHGGLRYLGAGQFRMARLAVGERESLLREAPGLVSPLGFLLATYRGDRPGRWTYHAGLSLYELLAGRWGYRSYEADDFAALAPHVARERLEGGFGFGDAQTDDARLVLRLIRDGVRAGGVALNYVAAEWLLRDEKERVHGVRLRDTVSGRHAEVRARAVVNATGAWADRLRAVVGGDTRIRALRGSHLVFPAWRFPVAQAISFLHPADRRPVFAFPWEGATLVGTTDLDHDEPLDREPRISGEEVGYLLDGVRSLFPSLGLTHDDVLATFAGVRPVIRSGRAEPSREPRDHAVWEDAGLLTVTGGKLTTFRPVAREVLLALRDRFPHFTPSPPERPVLDPAPAGLPGAEGMEPAAALRLLGRHGPDAADLVAAAAPGEWELVPGTPTPWAELRWAARAERVVRLEDLMLRRTRLGLLLPEGGTAILPRVRAICQAELGWDDERWAAEEEAYLQTWRRHYSLPDPATIPRREPPGAAAGSHETPETARRPLRVYAVLGLATAGAAAFAITLWGGRAAEEPSGWLERQLARGWSAAGGGV